MRADKSFNNSPYWSHVNKNAREDDRPQEETRANPDNLSETKTPWLPRYSEAQQEKLAAIQDSFSVLTDIERRVIVLIYTEALSQAEIGRRLKMSRQMIGKHINNARRKIKKVLQKRSST